MVVDLVMVLDLEQQQLAPSLSSELQGIDLAKGKDHLSYHGSITTGEESNPLKVIASVGTVITISVVVVKTT